MSANSSPPPGADRNLLFGILALQMEFISRDALIAAMHAWVLDKLKPLGQVLQEQGALSGDQRTLLEALVQEHLRLHNNDPEKSLAAVSSIKSLRRELESIADPDLHASLAVVASAPAGSPGSTIDDVKQAGPRYRILRSHARGGLGEVYVAEDQELHREVALKEIQPEHAHNPQSRSRFLLEAEITGGLDQAADAYRQAVDIAIKLTQTHPAVTQYQDTLATATGNLGQFYDSIGKLDKAAESLH
jgi:serine/threonine protein kinase